MKLFKNLLESVKPHFEKGGKLEKMYPAYDAFETFLFVPNHTTNKGAHIRDAIDLKRTMFMVIIALIPVFCLVCGTLVISTTLLLEKKHCFLINLCLVFGSFFHLLLFPMWLV